MSEKKLGSIGDHIPLFVKSMEYGLSTQRNVLNALNENIALTNNPAVVSIRDRLSELIASLERDSKLLLSLCEASKDSIIESDLTKIAQLNERLEAHFERGHAINREINEHFSN